MINTESDICHMNCGLHENMEVSRISDSNDCSLTNHGKNIRVVHGSNETFALV